MAFVMGLVTNWVIRKINLLNLIRVGHLAMATGFFAISQMNNFTTLIFATTLFGVGFGLINVGENILILEGTPPEMRRKFLSGLHSFYALASLIGPLAISIFISNGMGWREGIAWIGAVPLAAFALSFTAKVQAHHEPTERIERHDPFSWKKVLAGVSLGFYALAEILISSRVVVYLRRSEGVAPELAAQILAMFFVMVLLGRVAFTFINLTRFKSRNIMLFCLSFSFVTNVLGLTVSPYWIVLCGLCMAPMFGLGVTLVSELFPINPGRGVAFALSINAIMIVTMHFTVGYVTQTTGIQTAMLFGPVFLFLSWLILKLEPWKLDAAKN